MENPNKTEEPGYTPTSEPEHPLANETDSDTRTTPGSHAAPPASAKCECPPGCVGLPCCT